MDKFNQKKIENFQIQPKNDQKWSDFEIVLKSKSNFKAELQIVVICHLNLDVQICIVRTIRCCDPNRISLLYIC